MDITPSLPLSTLRARSPWVAGVNGPVYLRILKWLFVKGKAGMLLVGVAGKGQSGMGSSFRSGQ